MDYPYDDQNIFAKILRGEIPNATVVETKHTLAFRDIAPRPRHILVCPKGPYMSQDHFAVEASDAELVDFMRVVAKITSGPEFADGFRSISNTRAHGMQEVPHYHLHILAGKSMGPLLADRAGALERALQESELGEFQKRSFAQRCSAVKLMSV
jgi:histidine triad (HIT) family protein